ncbi:MAG: hypothetical protein ACI9J2_001209 [Saprospiraceae bacterium]
MQLYSKTDKTVYYSPVDSKYGDVTGDDVPDLNISRLPVQTNSELNSLLDKRAAYLARTYAGTAIFAADVYSEAEQVSFSSDIDAAINDHFSDWSVAKAYIDDMEIADARDCITDEINGGVSLFVYNGQSSNDRLSFFNLFSGDDAASISNIGQPTVVTQWGCWNTYNVEPTEISMSDLFLLEGNRGAVSVVGSSTLTDANAERIMSDLFYAELSTGKTLEQALLDSKRKFALDYAS